MKTLGSLCTGYGGLELGLEFAGVTHRLAFVADPDAAASKLLAHHHPGVPNLGDIRAVDWTEIPPVDILTAGYPCQPLSLAGRRAGLSDERWIWDDVFAAIRDLRPRIVFLENVPGHLSLGFGRVLGDLASIRFNARWTCLRASAIGAAHRRERVFIYAWPADTASIGHWDRWPARYRRLPAAAVGDRADPLVPTPGARLGKCTSITPATAKRRLSLRKQNLDDWGALLPTPRASDGTKGGPNQHGSAGDLILPSAVALLPTPTAMHTARNATANRSTVNPATNHTGWTLADVAYADRWGHYGGAIARWEQVTGRLAPEPTEPNRSDAVRLAPRFVEWLMGLPDGHVTAVASLTRNDQLRLLGNGVVPQQAATALLALAGAGNDKENDK